MPGFFRENSWPVVFSVLLHGLLALGFVIAAFMSHHREPPSLQPLPIDAVVVDSQMLRAAQKVNSDRAEQAIARAKAEEEARAAAAAAQAEAESHAAEEAQAAAAKQVEAAAAANAAEVAAKAAAAAAEQQQSKAAQAQRRTDAAKSAAAAEAAQRAELVAAAKKMQEAKQAAEAKEALEVSKRASEVKQAKAADEAKKAADTQAKLDREAELRRQLADEERRSAVQSGPLRDQYVASLRNSIQRAWIKPPSANAGIDCMVEVTQVPGGAVTGARVTQCNGDAAVRQSIENAVYRASPLPDPPDPALFERNFVFRFRPND